MTKAETRSEQRLRASRFTEVPVRSSDSEVIGERCSPNICASTAKPHVSLFLSWAH